jgi:DNA repair protein RecO (recombination protein O)
MLLAKGRNLDILTQSQTINNFLDLKKDLWRLACGLYVLELVDSFTIEGSESRPLFTSLLEILNELNAAANSEIALRYFELRLLRYAGYRPQLQRCAICDQPLRPELNFFEPSKGGIVCPHCYSRENPKARYPVSVEALKVFRLWQSCDYATAKRIKLKSNLSTELDHVLHGHISYLLGKELKSRLWLQRLKKELLSKERTATVNQGVC